MRRGEMKHYLLIAVIVFGVHLLSWAAFDHNVHGDELRYLDQAQKWLSGEGMYANDDIANPPVLPWILAQGLSAGLRLDQLPILSVLAVLFATLLLRAALSRYLSPGWASAIALIPAIHPAMLMLGHQLMTEPYTYLGTTIVAFGATRLAPRRSWIKRLFGITVMGLGLAFLAQLKAIFGYALATILVAAVPALLIILWRRRSGRGDARRMARWKQDVTTFSAASALALLLCSPYLMYTYTVTGGHFTWATETGDHVYWLAIGGEDVWGSWFPDEEVFSNDWLIENGYAAEIAYARSLPAHERDHYLIDLTLQRMRAEPMTYLRNMVANAGRLLFNYPYSFRSQSLGTYGYILPNMAIVFATLLMLPALWHSRKRQEPLILWVMLFYLIYLGGNLLVDTTARQSLPVLPMLLVWMAQQVRVLLRLGIIDADAWARPARPEPNDPVT